MSCQDLTTLLRPHSRRKHRVDEMTSPASQRGRTGLADHGSSRNSNNVAKSTVRSNFSLLPWSIVAKRKKLSPLYRIIFSQYSMINQFESLILTSSWPASFSFDIFPSATTPTSTSSCLMVIHGREQPSACAHTPVKAYSS
jgi:hypothetical protein